MRELFPLKKAAVFSEEAIEMARQDNYTDPYPYATGAMAARLEQAHREIHRLLDIIERRDAVIAELRAQLEELEVVAE